MCTERNQLHRGRISGSFPGLPAYTTRQKPGIRPIGVVEELQRVAGKVVMKVSRPDIQSAAWTLQICAGQ